MSVIQDQVRFYKNCEDVVTFGKHAVHGVLEVKHLENTNQRDPDKKHLRKYCFTTTSDNAEKIGGVKKVFIEGRFWHPEGPPQPDGMGLIRIIFKAKEIRFENQ